MSRMLPRSILITGSFRSGSTWVGRMIASHPRVAYLAEPLNVRQPPSPVRHFLPYVTRANEPAFRAYLRGLLSFRDPALYQIAGPAWHRWPRRLGRSLRCRWHRLRRYRPLLKDPTAFFAADWLATAFDVQVVVLIRHPAAFASSLKRLRWHFDFNDFLAQPELMRDVLWPFEDAIHRAALSPPEPIDQAILLWRIFQAQAVRYEQAHPEWLFVRHEDLSSRPEAEFGQLFTKLSLRLTRKTRAILDEHTRAGNPREAAEGVVHELHRDSRANVWSWAERLTADEVARVRRGTEDIASYFYSRADWQPPARRQHSTPPAPRPAVGEAV